MPCRPDTRRRAADGYPRRVSGPAEEEQRELGTPHQLPRLVSFPASVCTAASGAGSPARRIHPGRTRRRRAAADREAAARQRASPPLARAGRAPPRAARPRRCRGSPRPRRCGPRTTFLSREAVARGGPPVKRGRRWLCPGRPPCRTGAPCPTGGVVAWDRQNQGVALCHTAAPLRPRTSARRTLPDTGEGTPELHRHLAGRGVYRQFPG